MDKSRRSPWKVLSGLWSNYSFIFIFVVIFLAYYLVSPHLTWTGITNILRHSADVGIIALGMGLVVITGQIDLSVGSMLALAHKYGCSFAVATGGTLARQMVKQARPKAIVAVACERDLTSGIQDVFPLPVLGVLNERPFGPCFNTRVDINKLEAAILTFMDDEEAKEKHAKTDQQAS